MFDFTIVDKIINISITISFDAIANGLIYLAGILWGIELIPQVLKTLKTKDVNGLSLAFYIICLCAYVVYTIGNIMLGNWNIVIAHIPSLILFFTMLTLVLKYRRKNEKRIRKLK